MEEDLEFDEYENFEDEDLETYSVEDEDDDWSLGDTVATGGIVLGAVLVFVIIMVVIKKTFKSFHIKIGNKVDIGLETKDD